MSITNLSSIWDASAREYDRFEKKWHYYERVARRLVSPLHIEPDSSVLELASGTGTCTALLAKRCKRGRVVCIEGSVKMVEIAEKNLRSLGIRNVVAVRSDIGNLRELVKEGEFDYAICNSAFWQFPERLPLARSLHYALKKNGKLAFNIPLWYRSERDWEERRTIIEKVLQRHGIKPNRVRATNSPFDYPLLLKRSRFSVVGDSLYAVKMSAEERAEWREIPAFSLRLRRWTHLPQCLCRDKTGIK